MAYYCFSNLLEKLSEGHDGVSTYVHVTFHGSVLWILKRSISY